MSDGWGLSTTRRDADLMFEKNEQEAKRKAASSEIIAEATRHAWRYHKRCKGRGYWLIKGEPKVCSCAAKRMRRRLSNAGLL